MPACLSGDACGIRYSAPYDEREIREKYALVIMLAFRNRIAYNIVGRR